MKGFLLHLNEIIHEYTHIKIIKLEGGLVKEFDTEFCNVKYIEKDNVVLLTWK